VEEAYAAQNDFRNKLLTAGQAALKKLAKTGEPGVVLIGRTYSIYDRNLTCDLPRKLKSRYGANVLPLDFLVTGAEWNGTAGDNLLWESGRKILAAAQLASSQDNLHLIYASNFPCGPDAAARQITRRTAGEPLLFLKFDSLGWDSGYMTRCEAYLDSMGILRCSKSAGETVKGEVSC
jgi:predicted nucleotide-binding protein (sugar kinase/HSP70/actin superfamily)